MRHIAIVGTAPSCRDIAPWDDKSIDFWVCSPGNAYGAVKRCTVWFEIHSIAEMIAPENQAWSYPYFKWLKEQTFPIYMQEKNDYVPGAIVFPYKEMIKRAGTRNWFSSSPAWMMCKAEAEMTEGDQLSIFGIDMCADQEHYTGQKAGLIYWIERLQSKGIKVTIPLESCLGAPTPLYGYNESSRFGRRMNVIMRQISGRAANAANQLQSSAIEKAFCDGAIEQLKYIIRTWVDGESDAELDIEAAAGSYVAKTAPAWPAPKIGSNELPDPAKMPVEKVGSLLVPAEFKPKSFFPADEPPIPPQPLAGQAANGAHKPKRGRSSKPAQRGKNAPRASGRAAGA